MVLAATPMGTYDDASPQLPARSFRGRPMSSLPRTRVAPRRWPKLALDVTITGRGGQLLRPSGGAAYPGLVEAITDGQTVLVVTDAGMPSVSVPASGSSRRAQDAGHDDHLSARAVGGDDRAGRPAAEQGCRPGAVTDP